MAGDPNGREDNEILPRYVFLEPLLARARVLEVNAVALTAGAGAKLLKDRGAGSVVAVDANTLAIERAASDPELKVEGVEFLAGDYFSLGKRNFDLIIVHRCRALMN